MLIALRGPKASLRNIKINQYLAELCMYFKKWGLRLNTDKCTAILFKGKPKVTYPNFKSYVPTIKIGDTLILIELNI